MYYTKELIFIKSLNRNARLYIGLPNDYEKSNKFYPVLYMQDGHNVFDKKDSFLGKTWELIEAYEKDETLPEIIVVGLECAPGLDRLDEYGPFEFTYKHEFERPVGGKGDLYLNYLVHELKPYIDGKYRTLSDTLHTAIMGSSMGGVISVYAAVKYNSIFSRIASLSGAFFVSREQIIESIQQANLETLEKIYLDCGDAEVDGGLDSYFVQANHLVYLTLKEKVTSDKINYEVFQGAKHNEEEWAKRLPNVLKFLFS